MPVQPAYEHVLECDGYAVILRSSLRAAATIDQHPDGFGGLTDQISRQSLSAVHAVILATATDRQDAQRFLTATAQIPLSQTLPDAQVACLAVMAALFQAGDDSADTAPSQGSTSGAAMPLRDYFKTLYQFATGWLGWSPTEVWTASPAEIETAFAAHVDRLVKLTPGLTPSDEAEASASTPYTAERLRQIEEQGFDPAFDRAGLRALKAKQHAD